MISTATLCILSTSLDGKANLSSEVWFSAQSRCFLHMCPYEWYQVGLKGMKFWPGLLIQVQTPTCNAGGLKRLSCRQSSHSAPSSAWAGSGWAFSALLCSLSHSFMVGCFFLTHQTITFNDNCQLSTPSLLKQLIGSWLTWFNLVWLIHWSNMIV